jgi:hypothetical protein
VENVGTLGDRIRRGREPGTVAFDARVHQSRLLIPACVRFSENRDFDAPTDKADLTQDPRSTPQSDLRGSIAEFQMLRARNPEHGLGLCDEVSTPSDRHLVTAGRSHAVWASPTWLATK